LQGEGKVEDELGSTDDEDEVEDTKRSEPRSKPQTKQVPNKSDEENKRGRGFFRRMIAGTYVKRAVTRDSSERDRPKALLLL
jgi:hypothetical protein